MSNSSFAMSEPGGAKRHLEKARLLDILRTTATRFASRCRSLVANASFARRASQCQLCEDGMVPKNGRMYESCRPGQVPNADNSTCVACPLNTYNPDAGGTSCLSCPTNEFTTAEGSRECKTCDQTAYYSGGECVYLKIDEITPEDLQRNPTRGGGLLEIEGEGFKPNSPFVIVVEIEEEPPLPCKIVR